MNDQFEIQINRLAYGGDAIGRLADGRAVFVPFAIPGETVRIRLVEEKPRYARAELVEVLEPSPRRVAPRCAHFTFCGGCHYQHMDYPAQVEAKSAILREQLERIGGIKDIPEVETIAAEDHCWNYRNHIQFHLTRDGKLGYQRAHSNQTFAIRECHLPEPAINLTWPLIDVEPIPGLERISLRLGTDEDLMLILESSDPQPLEFSIEGLSISVVHTGPAGDIVLAGSDLIRVEVLGRMFAVSSSSFFQVNTTQASKMIRHILENLPLHGKPNILDVYCGVGLISAFLALKAKNLVGIEISPQSCSDFSVNLDEFDHVSLYEAPAEDVLNSINFHPDAVIVDPPREGLGSKTLSGLLAQEARYLVYVSCDPSTLGRDARRLAAGGYKLAKLTLVDMFPQTYHIESISYWGKS